jgi:hypothetical protein
MCQIKVNLQTVKCTEKPKKASKLEFQQQRDNRRQVIWRAFANTDPPSLHSWASLRTPVLSGPWHIGIGCSAHPGPAVGPPSDRHPGSLQYTVPNPYFRLKIPDLSKPDKGALWHMQQALLGDLLWAKTLDCSLHSTTMLLLPHWLW